MAKNIYSGYNLIYEQLSNEDSVKKDPNSPDMNEVITSIYGYLVSSVMIPAGMKQIKDLGSFDQFSNKLEGVKDLNELKNSVLEIVNSSGLTNEFIKQSTDYIVGLFNSLMKVPDINKHFQEIKILLGSLLESTKKIVTDNVKAVSTNESLLSEQYGRIGNDAVKKDSTSTENIEDENFSHKRYVEVANYVLDQATAFKLETSAPLLDPKLAANPQIKSYSDKALSLYDQAINLQVIRKRKGIFGSGKIPTNGGNMSNKDFKIACENLAKEIRRYREQFGQTKQSLTKIPAAPIPDKAMPKLDVSNTGNNSRGTKKSGGKSTGGSYTLQECNFPIPITSKRCENVRKLQIKLMTIPCINEVLSKHGGADGKYGKYTALATNIVYGQIKGTSQPTNGELTADIYNKIIGTNLNESNKFTDEFINGKVLNFSNFGKVIRDRMIMEQFSNDIIQAICKTFRDEVSKMDSNTGASTVNPVPVKTNTGGNDKQSEEEINIPGPDEWQGIKYVQSGTYPVAFDESLLKAWTKELAISAVSFALPGSGYLMKAGSYGLRSLGVKAATKIGAKKIASKLTGKGITKAISSGITKKSASEALSGLSKMTLRKYGKVAIPKRVGGLLGGTLGASALDFLAGRDSFIITVAEGFIDRPSIIKISKGLVNTIDGYVSDEDFACISTILSVVKGAWTVDDSDRPVSAWGEIKRLYQLSEGEDLTEDIKSISAKAGDVEGYPKMRSTRPLSSVSNVDWDIAREETFKFLDNLDNNESLMRKNIKSLPKEYVKAHAEGNYIEVDEEGEIIE